MQVTYKWISPDAEKLFDMLIGLAQEAQQKIADDLHGKSCLAPAPWEIQRARREAIATAQPYLDEAAKVAARYRIPGVFHLKPTPR